MNIEYIKQRVRECITYLTLISESANEDTLEANKVIAEIRSETDETAKMDLIKKFKKIQFFNNFKLMESEKIIPRLLELVDVAKIIDIDLELTEEEEDMISLNKTRFSPSYALDKGTIIFINKELEEIIDKELEKPSSSDMQAINNILKVINGEK